MSDAHKSIYLFRFSLKVVGKSWIFLYGLDHLHDMMSNAVFLDLTILFERKHRLPFS